MTSQGLPEWEVDLVGDESDLNHLVRHFTDEPCRIWREEQTGQVLMRVALRSFFCAITELHLCLSRSSFLSPWCREHHGTPASGALKAAYVAAPPAAAPHTKTASPTTDSCLWPD
jgi:hypothetical protein